MEVKSSVLLSIFAFGVLETWKELRFMYSDESSIKLKWLYPCGVHSFFSCKYSYLWLGKMNNFRQTKWNLGFSFTC